MPARPPSKLPLSRERVIGAALTVADNEGIAALTMRRVAEVLDCEAMTLYYYVDGKKALLEALTEAVVGEVAVACLDPDLTADAPAWRDVIWRRCLAAREVVLSHPWAPSLLAVQPRAPSTAHPLFEALVATMVEAGCSYELAHRAIHALGSMLFGFTLELFEGEGDEDLSPRDQGLDAAADALPHLARMAEVALHEEEGTLGLCDTQAEYEFTLGLILDGLAAHAAAES